MRKLITAFLLILFIICISYWARLMYQRFEPKEKYINEPIKQSENILAIYIPKIGKRLRVDPLNVEITADASKWPISTKGVNLITATGEPGSGGNSIIFGHDWKSIFGDLHKLTPGDEIIVYRGDNYQRLFRVSKISLADPRDGTLLVNRNQNELTLYTCAGLLDSERLVVTARYVEGLGGSI
jgi:LPXTG-site transpeptidase (sortase) family protein